MEYTTKKLSELTAEEFKKCSRLTYGKNGYMWFAMRDFRNDPNTWVELCSDGDTLMGWSLSVPSKKMSDFPYFVTDWAMKTTRYTVQIYVRSTARRKGIGGELFRRGLRRDPRPFVFPHSVASGALYKKFKVRATRGDRADWL